MDFKLVADLQRTIAHFLLLTDVQQEKYCANVNVHRSTINYSAFLTDLQQNIVHFSLLADVQQEILCIFKYY